MTPLQSVAGRMEMTHAAFQHACQVVLTELVESPVGDNHIVHLLCEAVRCSRECCEIATSQANGFSAGERKGRLDNISLLSEAVSILRSIDTPVTFVWHKRQIDFLSKLEREAKEKI